MATARFSRGLAVRHVRSSGNVLEGAEPCRPWAARLAIGCLLICELLGRPCLALRIQFKEHPALATPSIGAPHCHLDVIYAVYLLDGKTEAISGAEAFDTGRNSVVECCSGLVLNLCPPPVEIKKPGPHLPKLISHLDVDYKSEIRVQFRALMALIPSIGNSIYSPPRMAPGP